MEITEKTKIILKGVLRTVLAIGVTTALTILAEHYVSVELAWAVAIGGAFALAWLHGFHKPLQDALFGWHGALGLWFILALIVICVLLSSLYYYFHPKIVDRAIPAGEIRISPRSQLKYVWIPSGTFTMGCSPTDAECNCPPLWQCHFEENPAHAVRVSKGFWMGQTEVTVAAYKTSLSASGRQMPVAPGFNPNWEHETQPMVNVTWDAAKTFCIWDGGRLPTEAEWEYAARGRSALPQYGNVDEIMWYSGNSNGTAHDVATKVPNYIGLFDMLGNAWEWVDDWYDEDYYKHSPPSDPKGPENGNMRVLRGGSWSTGPRLNRLADRNRDYPASQAHGIGVRCLQDN